MKTTLEFENLVNQCVQDHHYRELAIGFLRYEALRKLKPREFDRLHKRNLAGENFDAMVTELAQNL